MPHQTHPIESTFKSLKAGCRLRLAAGQVLEGFLEGKDRLGNLPQRDPMEAGNYPVVGAIVNRKGYVRFFSYKRAFNVSVYGAGMEVIDEQSHVYKFDKIGSI